MPCYHPITAFRSRSGRKPDGSWPLFFDIVNGDPSCEVTIPCGKCIGCRLSAARKWAVRCVHEAQMHDFNSWLTLTYDDSHYDASLNKRDWQLFVKRLRDKIYGQVRYFMCGEYGESFGRPHYHACMFGLEFDDRYLWSGDGSTRLFRSDLLESVWPHGHALIGQLTIESAAYTAGYCLKKLRGATDRLRMESRGLLPEFTLMSRRPGVASEWWSRYSSDVISTDRVILPGGLTLGVPRYYYSKVRPDLLCQIKSERVERRYSRQELDAMEAHCFAKRKLSLGRRFENGCLSGF